MKPLPPPPPSDPGKATAVAASVSADAPVPLPSSTPPASDTREASRFGLGKRLRAWVDRLHHDPDVEEAAAEEHRRRLLANLTDAVAEAPDDTPIRDVIKKLNSHWDD